MILDSHVDKFMTATQPVKECQDTTGLRIKTDRFRMKNVYCDMELTCGGTRGGWMRIANLDTTHGDGCPGG